MRSGLFSVLLMVALGACGADDYGDRSAQDRRQDNEVSAEMPSIENQDETHLAADSRKAEEFDRWRERVLPTPKDAFPKVGTCYQTTIKETLGRLGGPPDGDSGSAVLYDNGLYQVSYEVVPQIVRSRSGDSVTMCVIELPSDCPAGDFRGVVYQTQNRRTGQKWELPDSQHDCGGA